ncbi:MAG: hypothetical protein ACYS15_08185 [Planctomycetota bacterium]|jgi:hypothetical protein
MKRKIARLAGRRRNAQGVAAVAMVVILLIIDLAIVGIVVGLSRDHDLTIRRMQTIEALYAAEAGVNMSIREMMNDADEDGDVVGPGDGIGTISHDEDDGTDPTLGNARFVVTKNKVGNVTTLTSEGRSGEARRTMEAELQDAP